MMRSWLVFEGPIRMALHQLKYHRNVALGEALAQHFAELCQHAGLEGGSGRPGPFGERTD